MLNFYLKLEDFSPALFSGISSVSLFSGEFLEMIISSEGLQRKGHKANTNEKLSVVF